MAHRQVDRRAEWAGCTSPSELMTKAGRESGPLLF